MIQPFRESFATASAGAVFAVSWHPSALHTDRHRVRMIANSHALREISNREYRSMPMPEEAC
jgi:hypothetical protein